MSVESRPDSRGKADDPSWKRFYDEIFSLRACIDVAPEPLMSKLASVGVEMIVDARSGNAKTPAMAADCEGAGMYYVPALGKDCKPGFSADAAARYAKLAMRHKTASLSTTTTTTTTTATSCCGLCLSRFPSRRCRSMMNQIPPADV